MSEVCDALVIVVSEETGLVSVAMGGQPYPGSQAGRTAGKAEPDSV